MDESETTSKVTEEQKRRVYCTKDLNQNRWFMASFSGQTKMSQYLQPIDFWGRSGIEPDVEMEKNKRQRSDHRRVTTIRKRTVKSVVQLPQPTEKWQIGRTSEGPLGDAMVQSSANFG
jgi:hypothetical protein